MNVTYYLEYDAGEFIDIIPYNYDDIIVKMTPDASAGAWQLLPQVNEVIVGGVNNTSQYNWLHDRITTDKCRMVYFVVQCGNRQFNFKFNYYNCVIDRGKCMIKFKASYYLPKYEKMAEIFKNPYNISDNVADVTIISISQGYAYNKAKRVRAILDYFCGIIGCTWESVILSNIVTPMPYGGGSFPTPYQTLNLSSINIYYNLHIAQSSNNADKIELSMEDLLGELCNGQNNLRWKFDELNNRLTIEHYSYFLNSESYTNPAQVGIDATVIDGGRWVQEATDYTISEGDYASRERWNGPTPESDLDRPTYRYGFNLRFFSGCVNTRGTVKEYRKKFETNVRAIEELGKSSTLLCACNSNQQILEYPDGTNIIINYPYHGGVNYKWWMWNRMFRQTLLIQYDALQPILYADPESTIMSIEQSVDLPLCCDNINEYRLIRMPIGDAWLKEYEIKICTGITTLKLKYEDV